MMRLTILLCAWLGAIAFAAAVNPAQAGNNLSFVSSNGFDSNDCSSPAAACRTFAGALAKTLNGGEIDCVNATNYGSTFTIAQSVTIDCNSGVGSTFGLITVNAPGIVVRLRNLSFTGVFLGNFGIDAKNMAALYVENCIIANYSTTAVNPPFLGIKFEPSANSQLFVSNTIISANGLVASSTGGGISIAPTGGATASVTLKGVELLGNVFGIGMNSSGGTIVGALNHSTISGSNVSGLVAFGGGSPIFWTVDDSKIMNNPQFGIQTIGSGVHLQIGASTITGNGTGVSGPGIASFRNNQISGNAVDGTPLAPVPAGLQ